MNTQPEDEFKTKVESALAQPKNLGELADADAVGTVGSAECGDMLRLWVKFRDDGGRRVIDRATFQTFGCETAIAVASVATELITGKTAEEALNLDSQALAAPLGALPPLKIHCAQLVEGALRSALDPSSAAKEGTDGVAPTLLQKFQGDHAAPKKVVLRTNHE